MSPDVRPRAVVIDCEQLRSDLPEPVRRLREAGIPVAIVLRSLLDRPADVRLVAGDVGAVLWCPHGPDEDCLCFPPAPGLLLDAAALLGLPLSGCAVISHDPQVREATDPLGAWSLLLGDDADSLMSAVDRVLAEEPAPTPGAIINAMRQVPHTEPGFLSHRR